MKGRYFCEVVLSNDKLIRFQLVDANYLSEVVDILKRTYVNIKEWSIKDLMTEVRYTNEDC